ncbi:MAG: hypothetical protein LAT67_07735 [Balneolales bacterium]|nr:hypothetical protein [Balneolales bacterium]
MGNLLKEKKQTSVSDNYKRDRLGCFPGKGYTEFRLFCPRASAVMVEIFDNFEQKQGRLYSMSSSERGVWQITIPGNQEGKLYGYRVIPPSDEAFTKENPNGECIADPYSRLVTTKNHYRQYPKSVIYTPAPFDWEGDTFVCPDDPRDLVIYEAHIKDMSAHPSAACAPAGTYKGFISKNGRGGLNHLKKMGINAVELLPVQKFAYFEPPHNQPISDGVINTWNYYGRNYWGYMTSFFFAPETLYATDGSAEAGRLTGKTDAAIRELKELVKTLHKENITVIMDVVYNHVSQYDLNPFKLLDKEYYFRLNADGSYRSDSGCGNDFKTEAPMARELIVESICYWMEEFHIDGFRFDLANLIDRDTFREIKEKAEAINPKVVLIAEPWGGGYDPTGFSELEIPSWNDQIRNGVKGSDPVKDKGFIFGGWQWDTSRQGLENFLAGSLLGYNNGRYHKSKYCVNYLESHDGYTLADFIRIGLNHGLLHSRNDRAKITRLNPTELKLCKLAAAYLFASQGICMIHAGQEWGRSKVVEDCDGIDDPYAGMLDHNSYEKDNLTNYLNFNEQHDNAELVGYYKGLIQLRLASPALRKTDPENIRYFNYQDSLHVTALIIGKGCDDPYDYIVTLNGNPQALHRINLPAGVWEIVVSGHHASSQGFDVAASELLVEPSTAYILRRLRDRD